MDEITSAKSRGGKARAEKLSPEERSEIAKKGASAKWEKSSQKVDTKDKATHAGVLKIGDSEIPCYVLENGERILSTRGVMKSLGRTWRGRKYSGTQMPVFIEAKNLIPFVSDELSAVLTPVYFKTPSGTTSEGYKAQILPLVCEAYLSANDVPGTLTGPQRKVAKQCEILVRGLSRVGIIALVDEATGYQYDRDKEDLQRFLAIYLSEERLKWAKMFPDEYYKQLFRLWGWNYSPLSVKRPKYVGILTNTLVYEKLPANVIEELKRLNPVKNKKTHRRGAANFQYLSADIGQSDLRDHLLQLIAIMRVSPNKDAFRKNFARAFPRPGDQFDLFDDE